MEKKNPTIERRQHDGYQNYKAMKNGRSGGHIVCPFCNRWNFAYVTNLAGTGKRCENCNAIIYSREVWLDQKAVDYQRKKNITINPQ